MGLVAFLTGLCLFLLTLGIVRVWQAGVEYGDRRRLLRFKAHAMVADELHAARLRRRAGEVT